MSTIKSYGYNIEIGNFALKQLNTFLKKNKYSKYFIVCDENTVQNCLPLLITTCSTLNESHIIEIESGEESKTLEISIHIWQTLIENQADKNALVINLGGGVVSDLGGFCASIYKRGISFINVPTSLLSMADASVGGKTGIDFSELKNSLGTFSQPKAVFVNPLFLKTLPQRHYQNGLAEIYKLALVSDKNFWKVLKAKNQENVLNLIIQSITLKNKIVLKDPYDKGIRKVLNFGHTIGHAIESLFLNTENKLLHGEAIVIGMIIESHLSFQKKLISKTDFSEIVAQLQSDFKFKKPKKLNLDSILTLLINDKKMQGNKLLFSLIAEIGSCKIDVVVTKDQISRAIEFYNALD